MLRRGGEIGKHNCSYPIFLLMEKNGVEGSRLSKTYGFESRPCREENVSRTFKLNEVVVWLSSQGNQHVGMSMGVRRKRLWRQRGNNLRLPCSLTFHCKRRGSSFVYSNRCEKSLKWPESWLEVSSRVTSYGNKVYLPAFTENKQRLALSGCSRVG